MREVGLEPTRLAAREPKSRTAANYATPAYQGTKKAFILFSNKFSFIFAVCTFFILHIYYNNFFLKNQQNSFLSMFLSLKTGA